LLAPHKGISGKSHLDWIGRNLLYFLNKISKEFQIFISRTCVCSIEKQYDENDKKYIFHFDARSLQSEIILKFSNQLSLLIVLSYSSELANELKLSG
jgi:hypothetical protein